MYADVFSDCLQRRIQGGIQEFIPPKLPKLDLTTDAEYVANLADVSMWLQTCNSAVYYMYTVNHKNVTFYF